MSSPHCDCGVQTSPATGGTLLVDDAAAHVQAHDPTAPCHEGTGGCADPSCGRSPGARHKGRCAQQQFPAKLNAAQRHLSKYEPQQLQEMSDEIEHGWDCAICLETAEDPCVTRCGHLYCQSHLNHWLSTHPSCPVCKTLCTPAQDVVPIFSRGRASPAPSSCIPSSPVSPTLSDEPCHEHDLYTSPTLLTPQSRSGSPLPNVLRRQSSMTRSDCVMCDYDIMPDGEISSTPYLPRVPPTSPSPSTIQPHPHPLMASYLLAHYVGIALRIVGVGILLGVLLR